METQVGQPGGDTVSRGPGAMVKAGTATGLVAVEQNSTTRLCSQLGQVLQGGSGTGPPGPARAPLSQALPLPPVPSSPAGSPPPWKWPWRWTKAPAPGALSGGGGARGPRDLEVSPELTPQSPCGISPGLDVPTPFLTLCLLVAAALEIICHLLGVGSALSLV